MARRRPPPPEQFVEERLRVEDTRPFAEPEQTGLKSLTLPTKAGDIVPYVSQAVKKKLPGLLGLGAKVIGPAVESKMAFRKRLEKAAESGDMPPLEQMGTTLRLLPELLKQAMEKGKISRRQFNKLIGQTILTPNVKLPIDLSSTTKPTLSHAKELARAYMDDVGYRWLWHWEPTTLDPLIEKYFKRLWDEQTSPKGGTWEIGKEGRAYHRQRREIGQPRAFDTLKYHSDSVKDVQEPGEIADLVKHHPGFRDLLSRLDPTKDNIFGSLSVEGSSIPENEFADIEWDDPSNHNAGLILQGYGWPATFDDVLDMIYEWEETGESRGTVFTEGNLFLSRKIKEFIDKGYSKEDIKKLFKEGIEHYQKYEAPEEKNTGGVIRNPYGNYEQRAI